MNCSIVDFWRRCDGPVHPDDAEVLASNPHSLNLDYPPPAYIGDPRTAPVVLLNTHGGYHEEITRDEFSDEGSPRAYLARLHDPVSSTFGSMRVYYPERNYWPLIVQGNLVLVNALAYRTNNVDRDLMRIAERLSSVHVHRDWLFDEVVPSAARGKRLIVIQHKTFWDVDNIVGMRCTIRCPNQRMANIDKDTFERIGEFLQKLES